MNDILVILHLIGFGLGVAMSIGNFTIMQLMRASPGDAPALGKVPPVFARIGQVGLGLLWVTGIIMVWTIWGGPQGLPPAFWWKFLCVVLLTGLVIYIDLSIKRMRAGDASVAARLPFVGRISAALLFLVVMFAVVAFH